LAGADNWTHWWHGPDNNAVSEDRAFALPETVQWTGKPFFSTRVELPIVANGRLFMLWNGHQLDMSPGSPMLAAHEADGPLLTAQAVGSGVRLWTRQLSPDAWLQIARSTMVADGDTLFVADGEELLELDQVTGKEVRRAKPQCGEIRWMAVADGRILLLGGPQTTNFGQRSSKAVIPFRSSGLSLLAMSRDKLEMQWRVQRENGQQAFDPRSPAIDDGCLFMSTVEGQAEAYRLSDGQPLWSVPTGITRRLPISFEWDRSSRHPVTGYALRGMYITSSTEQDRCAVLSQKDGRSLWQLPRGGSPIPPMPFLIQDQIWVGRQSYDPVRGEVSASLDKLQDGGCSRWTACPQGILGTTGLIWDLQSRQAIRSIPAKSSCGAGSLVANGLIWKFPTPCSNCTEWRGFIARTHRERSAPPLQRLVSADVVAKQAVPPTGWTTYRGDARRSASTAARVGPAAEIIWTQPPLHPVGLGSRSKSVMFDAEIVPAPPIIAGQTVIVGGGDGAVDALDLKSGRRRWRAYTGGRVYSSPAAWEDRVLAGSADGWLYAFSLEDGRETWRLRIAPQAGRVMFYEQLGSRWPVLGAPLVQNNRVYATAGLLEGVDGVHAIAADAATGKILWDRHDWNEAGLQGQGMISGAGQACWQNGVVFHPGESPLVRLDAGNGACRPAYNLNDAHIDLTRTAAAAYRCSKGQEVGALVPDWIVFGGRRLLTDQEEDGAWRNNLTFLQCDDRYNGRFPLLQANDTTHMPAWDERDVAVCAADKKTVSAVSLITQAEFRGFLREALGAQSSAKAGATSAAAVRNFLLDACSCATWRKTGPFVIRSLVLTADAVVTLESAGRGTKAADAQVVARSRTDGKLLWTVSLPGVPIHEGIAIAADGRIVIALRDGRLVGIAPR
jgi:outer membrane protein assembly factor BamB